MQRKYFGARCGIQSQRPEIVGDTRERKSGDACYHIAQLFAPPAEARGDEFPERRNFLRLDERLRERRESHDRAAHFWRRPEGSGSYMEQDRKSTRLNSSHGYISYAVFCLKKKKTT